MASSLVELVNLSLIKINAAPVAALTETVAARTANVLYPTVRDKVLNEGCWNCATKRAAMNQEVDAPAFGYLYSYVLPTDFIRLVTMEDKADLFRIESGKVLSNLATMNIVYIFRQTDISKMDPLLQGAIVALLASELAVPLFNSQPMRDRMYTEYKEVIASAQFSDAHQAPTETAVATSWVKARFGEDIYPISTEVDN